MRTTVGLDVDVATAAEQIVQERGISLEEAVIELARLGLSHMQRIPTLFSQRTKPLGLHMDITNIGETLDYLDGIH